MRRSNLTVLQDHQPKNHGVSQTRTDRRDTPTNSCFWRQCETSDLNANISNLGFFFLKSDSAQPLEALCQKQGSVTPRKKTHTMCKTLTNPVNPRNQGLVSRNMRLTSSSSEPEAPPCCLAASLNPCVIDAKIWNFKNDIGWKVICSGREVTVEFNST